MCVIGSVTLRSVGGGSRSSCASCLGYDVMMSGLHASVLWAALNLDPRCMSGIRVALYTYQPCYHRVVRSSSTDFAVEQLKLFK